jgi:invasion protein IalB
MRAGFVFAPARPARRMATCIAAVATLALGTSVALAQQPAPTPPAPAPAAPKAAPKPVQQKAAPKQPAPAPQQPAQQQPPAQPQPAPNGQQQAGAQGEMPPIVFSPWTKFCGKDNAAADAKEACLILKEARLETGQFLAGAAVIEQAGQEKKLVRITVPLTMLLQPGTRVQVDKEPAINGKFVLCMPNGCIADHEVDAAFVAKLKKGQQFVLQSANMSGQTFSVVIPLADFAKAYDGPATDPKKAEEDAKKMQDEMQKKAEEARKRLQASPPPQK